jgi:hypothetical protein
MPGTSKSDSTTKEPDEARGGGAEVGDDGEQRVAQRMDEPDAQRRHALGARGAHVIQRAHFHQRAARQAGERRGGDQAERGRRQDEVLRFTPAARRQPAQAEREDQREDRAEHEGGHADADEREAHRDAVQPAVRTRRGEHADGHADEDGDEERGEAERARDADARADDLADGPARILERGPRSPCARLTT